MAPGGKAGPKVKVAPVSNSSITPMMWTSFGHSRLKCAAWCALGEPLVGQQKIGIQVFLSVAQKIGRTCSFDDLMCKLFNRIFGLLVLLFRRVPWLGHIPIYL